MAASLTPNAPSRIILEVRPAQFALKNAASIERGSASPLPPITRRQGHGLPPMPRQARPRQGRRWGPRTATDAARQVGGQGVGRLVGNVPEMVELVGLVDHKPFLVPGEMSAL